MPCQAFLFIRLARGKMPEETVHAARKKGKHGGQTVPVVLVDGLAAGVWSYDRRGKKLEVSVRPFEPFDPGTRDLVMAEAEDIGRFFCLPVALAWR
jgi:hypothetical protein